MSLMIDLKHTLKAFRKYLWIVIAFFIIAGTLSFANAWSHGMKYTATSSFLVGANIPSGTKVDYYAYAISHQLVYTCDNLIRSNTVISNAEALAGLKTNVSGLTDAIQTKISLSSDYIELDITTNSNASAISLSNALVESLNDYLPKIDTAIPLKITVIDKPVITETSGGRSSDVKTGLLGGIAGIFVALALILIITAVGAKEEK